MYADEDKVDNTFTFSEVPVGLRAIVIQLGARQVTRYIQVPHSGLSLAFDFSNDNQSPAADANSN